MKSPNSVRLILVQVGAILSMAGCLSVSNDTSAPPKTQVFVVADSSNNRVLIWNSMPKSNSVPADVVLGQPDFLSNTLNNGGVSAKTMQDPDKIHFDGKRLFVTDADNHRILIWNSIPTTTQKPADVVLGQPDFISNVANNGGLAAFSMNAPWGVFSDGTRVFVADCGNNRVLIWNSQPTANGQLADLVLGQPNMTSGAANNGGVSAQSMSCPVALYSDGKKLIVTDASNNRVLIWNSIPTSNFVAADVVMGQPDFTSNASNNGGISAAGMSYPNDVVSDGKRLIIADVNNNRILIWNSVPLSNHTSADVVVGQANMTAGAANGGGATSASVMSAPYRASTDGTALFVGDCGNNRMMIWNTIPVASSQNADILLGQADSSSSVAGVTTNKLNCPSGATVGWR